MTIAVFRLMKYFRLWKNIFVENNWRCIEWKRWIECEIQSAVVLVNESQQNSIQLYSA